MTDTDDVQPTTPTAFPFKEQQEQLRAALKTVLKEPGVTLQRVADLDPELTKRWVGDFARAASPTANIEKLEALQRALKRLEEAREFERSLVSPQESSAATA